MNSACTVLVVVPDGELRRSIEFAFEAEGFAIERCATLLEAAGASARAEVVCLVVDENAIVPVMGASPAIQPATKPVILLVDKLRGIAAVDGLKILTKPLLGHLLVDTVADVIAHSRPPALRSSP